MRIGVFILGLFFVLGCESNGSRFMSTYVVNEADHLGEYLQVESQTSLITVKRNEGAGLARYDLNSKTIEILDPTAGEARDILFSNGSIAYRLNQSIRIWSQSKIIEVPAKASRLRFFSAKADEFRIAWDNDARETFWRRLNSGLTTLAEGSLPGSPRAAVTRGDQEILALQNTEGLSLYLWRGDTIEKWTDIERGRLGSYVTMRELDGKLSIAYFDETSGILKIATESSQGFSVEAIDGEATKTYRGMDIAIFRDRNGPGLIYLDAWALKLRMARRNTEGKWDSEELPARGALGFYSQIIEESETRIKVGYHSFRTDHSDRHQSFEDLIISEIRL